ncbi:MAG: helix-turn-helix transcriptional regulator [Chitinophagaceae bacterium]
MNRVDRLHAILVHLQSKKRVTAQEIADRFGLSLRTVYRDIKALDEAGVPIIGEAGFGYSVMEGYRLPPILFTKEEAAALLLGAKFVQRFTDRADRRAFDGAMFKVKAVLRSSDREYVEELESRISIQSGPVPSESESELNMAIIRQALVERRVLRVRYCSAYKEETTVRDIEPIGLLYYSQSWHMIGWCRLRRDYRDFRADRIQQADLLDVKFNDEPHPSLKEYVQQLRTEKELTEVVISFESNVARMIAREKYLHGFVSEQVIDDRVHMRFLTAYPEYLGRWLLSFTDSARIETEHTLTAVMEKLLGELRSHY